MTQTPNLYKIVRKDDDILELSGLMQTVEFSNKRGYESTSVRGKESSLKILAMCDDKGFMNPGAHLISSTHDTDSLRVTSVYFTDSQDREFAFDFEDYIKWERPERLCHIKREEYFRPSK